MSGGGTHGGGDGHDRSDEIVDRLVHLEARLDQIEARFDRRFRTFTAGATAERDRIHSRLDEVITALDERLKTMDRLAVVAHWRGRRSMAVQPAGEVLAEQPVHAAADSRRDIVEMPCRPVTPRGQGLGRCRLLRNAAFVVAVVLVVTVAAVAVQGAETGPPASAAITPLPSILHPVQAPDSIAAPRADPAPARVMAGTARRPARRRPVPARRRPSPSPLISTRPQLTRHCVTVKLPDRDMRVCL